jgi:hypothetical protein
LNYNPIPKLSKFAPFVCCALFRFARAFDFYCFKNEFDKLLAHSEKDATDFIAYCVSGMVKHHAQKSTNVQSTSK